MKLALSILLSCVSLAAQDLRPWWSATRIEDIADHGIRVTSDDNATITVTYAP